LGEIYLLWSIWIYCNRITTGDNVAMATIPSDLNMLTNALSTLPKYKPPYTLGDLSSAMLDIADMTPEDMKQEDEEDA